ncbi:unnamed protein product, partial [Gulo gulo]
WWGRRLGQPVPTSRVAVPWRCGTSAAAACFRPPHRQRLWRAPNTTRGWAASRTGCGTVKKRDWTWKRSFMNIINLMHTG